MSSLKVGRARPARRAAGEHRGHHREHGAAAAVPARAPRWTARRFNRASNCRRTTAERAIQREPARGAQRIERDTGDYFPVIVSVGTTSGDRDMREGNVVKTLDPVGPDATTTAHRGAQHRRTAERQPAGQIQNAAYAGNEPGPGCRRRHRTDRRHERKRQQSRPARDAAARDRQAGEHGGRPLPPVPHHGRAAREPPRGPVGKVNIGIKEPLRTAGLSFDGPVK